MTSDERKEARSYAWSYFSLHADQRMKLFHFFLVLSGILLSATPAVWSLGSGSRLVALIPTLLATTALIFWRLEERTRELIKNSEEALRYLDKNWGAESPSLDLHPLQLFERDDQARAERKRGGAWRRLAFPTSYAESFRMAYFLMGATGAGLTILLLVLERPSS